MLSAAIEQRLLNRTTRVTISGDRKHRVTTVRALPIIRWRESSHMMIEMVTEFFEGSAPGPAHTDGSTVRYVNTKQNRSYTFKFVRGDINDEQYEVDLYRRTNEIIEYIEQISPRSHKGTTALST